jgi:hypothetical protein
MSESPYYHQLRLLPEVPLIQRTNNKRLINRRMIRRLAG